MVLGGQLVKHYYGKQGVLFLSEGCCSSEFFQEHSLALRLKDRQDEISYFPLIRGKLEAPNLHLVSFHPNGKETLKSWIFDEKLWISGLPPLPVTTWKSGDNAPKPLLARLHHPQSTPGISLLQRRMT